MNPTNPLVLLLVALALVGGPVSAADLNERITLDLVDAPADTIMKSLASILQVAPQIEFDTEKLVTIRLENVRVRTVLDALCDSVPCTWGLRDEGFGRMLYFGPSEEVSTEKAMEARLSQKVDMSFEEAPALDVLGAFASMLRVKLVQECEGAVAQTVTVDYRGITVADGIDEICGLAGCVCLVEPGELSVR